MELLLLSFIAGVLTILAPCVVSVLPILLVRSAGSKDSRSPLAVILGLAGSIIIFTVLLKATTLFIAVPQTFWQVVSGCIIILFGIFTVFPSVWEAIVLKTRFVFKSQDILGSAAKKKGVVGDVLLGASLGPVFSACSPTYALLVAVVLPTQPIVGLINLLAFVIGLSLMLLLIAHFGQQLIKKLGWGINPRGWFRRSLGILLVIIGIMITTGYDKILLGNLVGSGLYDFQLNLETQAVPEDL